MKEIERKFLVNPVAWKQEIPQKSYKIRQGYMLNERSKTVRVRTKGTEGFLTIKGATEGISRLEFEYKIPLEDAENLLDNFCDVVLDKTRYVLEHDGHIWEIDEFHGKLAPLFLAEIELSHENEAFTLPRFVLDEVSTNPDYFNANLIKQLAQ